MHARKIEQWCPEGRGEQGGYQIRWASSVCIPSGHPLGRKSSSWAYPKGVTEATAFTLLPECTGLGHPCTSAADSGSPHRFHPIWGRTPRARHIILPSWVRFPNAKVNIIFQTSNTILNHNTIYILNSHIFNSWIILGVISFKFIFTNQNHQKCRENHFYLIYNKI